jgi:hypothetical protein
MKKILLLAVASFCVVLTAQSQSTESSTDKSEAKEKPEVGLKLGLNLARFSTSVNSSSSSRPGFHFGFYMKNELSRNVYFRPEFYFSQQGQKDTWDAGGTTTSTLNYLNIPLLFEMGNKVTFQVGPQVGILLSAKEKGDDYNVDLKDEMDMPAADVGLILGVGFKPSNRVNFGIRYQHGFTDIFKADDDIPGLDFPDVSNRVFHFYLGVAF